MRNDVPRYPKYFGLLGAQTRSLEEEGEKIKRKENRDEKIEEQQK